MDCQLLKTHYRSKRTIDNAMALCFKNNIKVYPVGVGRRFKIESNVVDRITTFDKVLTPKQVNGAIEKTYFYYADKL